MRVLTEANCLEITGGLNLVYQDRSDEDGGSNGYRMPGVLLLDRWGDGGGSSGNMGTAGNGTNGSNGSNTITFALCQTTQVGPATVQICANSDGTTSTQTCVSAGLQGSINGSGLGATINLCSNTTSR
jgi:hypothetical protein